MNNEIDQLRLDPQALLERAPDAEHHALLVRADRALRQRGDLARQLLRARERLAVRDDLVDEPDALGLVDVDAAAGDDQLHRPREPDDERQANGHAVAADDVPAALESRRTRAFSAAIRMSASIAVSSPAANA